MEASSYQQYCLRWNNHSTNLQSEFHELLQKEAFTDVLLVVGDGASSVSLKCHKMVLAACSTFFQKLFFQAASTEQHLMLLMPDVKGWEMKAILEYMYQGEVCVLQERINDLLQVARMLNVKGLTDDESQNPQERTPSPSPAISSTHPNPAHSTSPYYPYGTSPSSINSPYISGWNHLSSLSMAAETVLNPLIGSRSTTLLPAAYEASESDQNQESTILRTVLGRGHADSSQGLSTSVEDLDLPGRLNGHSAFTADTKSKKNSKRKKSEDHQNRKSVVKNYKMYSKEQMEIAIERVKRGECALAVAGDMKIPSRTLYDKVSKLRPKPQKNGRRFRSDSGAHFPHGIGGNRNGAIYRRMSDPESASLALLDMARGQVRQSSDNSEASLDNSRQSLSLDDERPLKMDIDVSEEQKPKIEPDNDVQDLSVQRTNVIVSPSRNDIKEEKDDEPQD